MFTGSQKDYDVNHGYQTEMRDFAQRARFVPTPDDVHLVLGVIQRIQFYYRPAHLGRVKYPSVDIDTALVNLFDALGEAMAAGTLQVFLEALLGGIAQLSFMPPARAVELLIPVYEHPAADRYSRTQAKRVLAMEETRLSSDEVAAAFQRGLALISESAAALVEPYSAALDMAQPSTPQPLTDPLSQRELDVLVLVADGLTNQEIADRLYIGVSTVKKHINHIYSKLDVTHRAQAVARARALNILF
jgi:DNA-binding CsgD family transcriptional regulator